MKYTSSASLFEKAKGLIPGGVNSPVRAFRAVGGNPIFIKRAQGAYLFDEDDNQYIELINSWGPMILGHAHPIIEDAVRKVLQDSFSFGGPTRREVEMAEIICSLVPSAEMVRMVNSGTEATMSAIRLARGYTGKSKIIKFEGCYHGHGDSFLIAAGSGAITLGVPDSPGVTVGTANDTLTAPYNDLRAVQTLVDANQGQIACIIIEPVAGNMGLVTPNEGFLEGLRAICDKEGILLIFDEVMTGFRLAIGGVQERLGVMPDITTLGKIIGGGLPVGAYCGKKEIMQSVAPAGKVYQAGTLSGNPVAMAAGKAMLETLKANPSIYTDLERIGSSVAEALLQPDYLPEVPRLVNGIGSMCTLFFTAQPVTDFETAKASNTTAFGTYFRIMLENGVYLAPSQFESLFVSTALSEADIKAIGDASKKALAEVANQMN